MPIYEYYCRVCQGRFRHLARRFDEPAPPCPRCGSHDVERLISAVNVVRDQGYHQAQFKQEAVQVDGEDPQAIARFLKESGRLEDAAGLYGSKAYKELVERRAEGATDSDLADLVDDLVAEAGDASSELAQMASALALSKAVERRMKAEGPPEEFEPADTESVDREAARKRSRRSAEDLGWG